MKFTFWTILIIPFVTFGQSKFVGQYKRLLHFEDTLKKPFPEYTYNRHFKINSDKTFTYYEEQNPTAFDKPKRETIEGSWKANGDTIIFYNKNFAKPNGIVYNHIENQNFKGIKIVAKNSKGKILKIISCGADSVSSDGKIGYRSGRPFWKMHDNTISIIDTFYTTIHFTPEGFCEGVNYGCPIAIGLKNIKSGTLIEVVIYNKAIEIEFNGIKYMLTRNILHKASNTSLTSDDWDNFIRTK